MDELDNLGEIDDIPRTVLVVEDEPRLCSMLLRAIPDMGFDAVGAGSGEQALRYMAKSEPGMVVLDLNLPGIGGLSVFETIRQRWPDVQVIILTGYGDLDTAQQAIRLNVADFLSKPCSLGDLEAALDRAWRRRLAAVKPKRAKPAAAIPAAEPDDDLAPRNLQKIERLHIISALERHDDNRAKAAEELGISVRTLYYRLSQYGI